VALAEIEGVSQTLAALIHSISDAAQLQTSSAGQISHTMAVIQQITAQTSAGPVPPPTASATWPAWPARCAVRCPVSPCRHRPSAALRSAHGFAAVSPERHDTVALAWTKAAILDCLGQARQALERFAGEPGDLSMLAFVVDNLHQVHGCLRMLSCAAPRAWPRSWSCRQGAGRRPGQPTGRLPGRAVRGLEQLPPYLERLRGARHDLPLVMLPLLNQLRCRGIEPLAQASLISGAAQRFAGSDDLANLDLSLGNWRDQLQAGPGRDALRSVVTALCDDLMRIKERLDQFVRGDRQHSEQLDALLAPLRRGRYPGGAGLPATAAGDHRPGAGAAGLGQGERSVDDAVMDVAGALLYGGFAERHGRP
jgi:chemosensory pili system protein ChpA (sensor histidine kinase/response regulator)